MDFGAGTGRNAFALARLGHLVYAVEITPRFVEMLTEAAALETLLVRVSIEELSSSLLVPGGLLVVNIHFVSEHFEADDAERNWAQQCCSMFYSSFEVALAIQAFPLEWIAADDAYQFERTHLPEEHWPVTPAFVEWATGRHLHAFEQKHCPVTLKWLVMRKLDVKSSGQSSAASA